MKIDQSIFKKYDIRGSYPDQINEEVAYRIGQGYSKIIKPQKVVVGHDVRIHSEDLKKEMIRGLLDAGVDAVDIGLISTEMIYFATGFYGFDGGIQVTASHLPAEFHGAKLVKRDAEPVSGETGLTEIKDFVLSNGRISNENKGKLEKKDILNDFCNYMSKWVDFKKIQPLTLAINANFGVEGKIFDEIVNQGRLPLKIIKQNYEPDGTFPKGRPDPFLVENRQEIANLVRKENADLGVAWDADADRVFFIDDRGVFLESYYTDTLLIKKMLEKYPKGNIVYDPRNIWAIVDAIKKNGGSPVPSRVGHSLIKEKMRESDAIFSGENSGHTYYKDFWYADSGIIPVLQILEILSEEKKSLSELIVPVMKKYYMLGETNFKTHNAKSIISEIKKEYSEGRIDTLDGISIEYPDWRLNLRTSNTEPLLRLNMESKSEETLKEKSKEVLNYIEKRK